MEEETAKSPGSRKEMKDHRKVSEAEGKRWR